MIEGPNCEDGNYYKDSVAAIAKHSGGGGEAPGRVRRLCCASNQHRVLRNSIDMDSAEMDMQRS